MESLAETFLSKLNEFQQRTGVTIQYEEGSTGPSHNKTYVNLSDPQTLLIRLKSSCIE